MSLKIVYQETTKSVAVAAVTTTETIKAIRDTILLARGALFIEKHEQMTELELKLKADGKTDEQILAIMKQFPGYDTGL